MRQRPASRIAPALRSALLGALLVGGALHGGMPASAEGTDLTGRRAPELYVPQALQGVSAGTTLSTYAGKVLVLKFFFAGCPHCRDSLPGFESLYRQYAGRTDVQFLALAYDTADNVAPLVRANGYTFPVGLDPSGVTPHAYGVTTYPTHYLIGPDGVVKSYENISSWVIDREAAGARAPVESARERNIKELGDVPAVLEAAKEAAGGNDYGAVLRIVEAHLDAAKDTAVVVAAARRIQAIAYERYVKRSAKILSVWNGGNHPAAWRMITAFEDDFRGTSVSANIAKWIASFPEPRPATGVR